MEFADGFRTCLELISWIALRMHLHPDKSLPVSVTSKTMIVPASEETAESAEWIFGLFIHYSWRTRLLGCWLLSERNHHSVWLCDARVLMVQCFWEEGRVDRFGFKSFFPLHSCASGNKSDALHTSSSDLRTFCVLSLSARCLWHMRFDCLFSKWNAGFFRSIWGMFYVSFQVCLRYFPWVFEVFTDQSHVYSGALHVVVVAEPFLFMFHCKRQGITHLLAPKNVLGYGFAYVSFLSSNLWCLVAQCPMPLTYALWLPLP